MNRRMEQLDSIRGLASLSVMLHHLSLVTSISAVPFLFWKYSPFTIIISGHSAVILFFILSGFVLSLPFLNGEKISYKSYLLKRVCRIYIPYAIAMSTAMAMYAIFSKNGIPQLSSWFNISWTTKVNGRLILEHFLLIGRFNSDQFDNVIWSLIHEMRISIIFPVIGMIVMKLNWKHSLLIGIILSMLSIINIVFHFEPTDGYHTAFSFTLHYISMFLIGGIIAKERAGLVKLYKTYSSKKVKVTLFFIALCCYTYYWILLERMVSGPLSWFAEISSDYIIALGCTILIVFAMASNRIANILLKHPLKMLGNISYSLYLYHLIVLNSLVYAFFHTLQLNVIYLLTIVLSLIIAFFSYRYVETPAIRLGKYATKTTSRKNTDSVSM